MFDQQIHNTTSYSTTVYCMRRPGTLFSICAVLLMLAGCNNDNAGVEQPTATILESSSQSAATEDGPGSRAAAGEQITAFVNVSVVPMDSERIMEDQTVLVQGSRIIEIGPTAAITVPTGAQRIDGTGSYLIPGIAEMHGHLPSPNMADAVAENILFLYVANGVTTVRGMQGHISQLELRDRIKRGEQLGPQLILGSPAMWGRDITTAEDARRLVNEYHQAGFDLLKVHEGLALEVYDAIANTANALGIPFGGHVSDHVGVVRALQAGQITIDHLDNYLEAIVPEGELPAGGVGLGGVGTIIDRVDDQLIGAIVETTRVAGAAVVPTMVLWEDGLFPSRSLAELQAARPETKYMPAGMVKRWTEATETRLKDADIAANRKVAEYRRTLLSALHSGGVPILLGSDSPQIFSVPGFSIHREMQFYAEVGMSPYEVLLTGTRRVAEHFGATDDFGTVATGQRADLVLLEANPLQDISNAEHRAGVMVNGRWFSNNEIQTRLAEIEAYYKANRTAP